MKLDLRWNLFDFTVVGLQWFEEAFFNTLVSKATLSFLKRYIVGGFLLGFLLRLS